jgi:hypothetical protein
MKRLSALLLTTAALIGCNLSEHDTHAPEAQKETPLAQEPVGNLVKEFRVSDETVVRFRELNGQVTLLLEGHVDEKEANQALEDKLSKAKTMEEAYRMMDPAGAVPQSILDYDKLPAAQEGEAAPSAPETAGAVSTLPPLAKESDHAVPSSDSWWDWTADANWWKKDVVGYECQWHKAAYQTNYTSWDDWRQGWYGRGYLMAASHTYGADAWAYKWVNGAWSQTNYTYVQPRHYIVWYSGDASKQYRRYRVTGRGAYPRIHWGMRWDSQAPSDIGVICFYD